MVARLELFAGVEDVVDVNALVQGSTVYPYVVVVDDVVFVPLAQAELDGAVDLCERDVGLFPLARGPASVALVHRLEGALADLLSD